MGTYHEYRAPLGEPAIGEHDVWLDAGSVIWAHWDGSAWVVDATADAEGLVGVQGPEGEPCPTGGEADTLDGLHASEIPGINTWGSWYDLTVNSTYWDDTGSYGLQCCKHTNGLVWVHGTIGCKSSGSGPYLVATLPSGYVPSSISVWPGAVYYGASGTFVCAMRIVSSTRAFDLNAPNSLPFASGGQLSVDVIFPTYQ